MSQSNTELVWSSILAVITDVQRWNTNMPRLVQENGPEFKKFAQEEAARRGYMWSSESHCYVHPWSMVACDHPGRLIGVGWKSGKLACVFGSKNGPVRYESLSMEIPVETAQKLVNSLYPDNLYNQLIKRKDMQMVRVG